MPWVIDTCLLIDVAEADRSFGAASAAIIDSKRLEKVVICPISYIELAPVFNGDALAQNEFLRNIGVLSSEAWTEKDTASAHEAWNRYVQGKRQGTITKRPIADILIGAFSTRFDGLLTRNTEDFRKLFPTIRLTSP